MMTGTSTQMAVSTTLITIAKEAERFDPYDRKCWLQKEIQLSHFSYEEDYRSIFILIYILTIAKTL